MGNNYNIFNPFIHQTTEYNNFSISIEESIKFLNKLLNSKNYSNRTSYDFIDYEKLLFIENQYENNEEIMFLIKKIKNIISKNYLFKQQLLNKLILKK